MATNTLTILMTPGGSSSPFLSRSIFSSNAVLISARLLLDAATDPVDLVLVGSSSTLMSPQHCGGIASRAAPP